MQAFGNLIWDVSKEAGREADSYWAVRLPDIRELDAHKRPITIHSHWNSQTDLKNEFTELISDQQHNRYHEHILANREQFPKQVTVSHTLHSP